MIKVRYHLQKGEHYKHWQIKYIKTNEVKYVHPNDCIITLYNCVLQNNRKVADKIYMGHNKDVCSWVKCQSYALDFDEIPSWCTHLRYNPKVLPYWHTHTGRNIDGDAFDLLHLTSKGVFYNECRQGILNPLKVMT